ncbi:coiled-coil domain-containing protein 130 homolog [Homarus americanus]|uniref:Coiled-coil domain-containing protein 130-like n=1 Tax=Homarus americanus TaxID=6706 RepID=A0A8J5MGR9_HOMAM|nr:coiled-coil domain-containing protein 130 homolog [Homarus americanus]KAG7153336.1 Coiled-coil domain-containing protein 130-like [Homarus americanus]
MGERKGVNKYYPPDYDPSKGGLNKFQGTHALRERARKLHLGILIIRFEMPYNIWCEGCNNHIGTGVRYNAEKKKVGMYYSTPIYQFRMKCHLCDNHFEIKTDPANLDYEIVSGARRQERRWDPTENEQIVPEDKEVTRKMAVDAMYKLEHGVSDKIKPKETDTVLEQLEEFQASRWHDDYASNKALRATMRAKRVEAQARAARDALYHISVPLLPTNEDDARTAKLLQLTQSKTSDQVREEKRAIIDAQSVFAKLKTKKVPQTTKKAFARQSLKGIVSNSQKNLNNFKNNIPIGPLNLGIVPRKTSLQDSSEKLPDDSEGEKGTTNTQRRNLLCINNITLNSPDNSSSIPETTPSTSANLDIMTQTAEQCNFVSTNTEHVDNTLNSQICQKSPQVSENSTAASSSVKEKVQCLVSYDLSASDSDDSFQ